MLEWIEQHPATISLITALLALVVSGASLYISLTHLPEDETPVRKLIQEEAKFAREKNVEGSVQLFTDDAVVRDVGFTDPPLPRRKTQSWIGKSEIRKRYEMIKDKAEFPQLEHIGVRVDFDQSGLSAGAVSSTQGKFRWEGGEEQDITTVNGDSWSFVKIDGQWKISDVSFHSPPSK